MCNKLLIYGDFQNSNSDENNYKNNVKCKHTWYTKKQLKYY